jgi:fluoride exporter
MTRVLLIGLAGALGTLARYGVALWAGRTLGTDWPFGTLIVNVVGSFLIVLVWELALKTTLVPDTLRPIITTGFIGGLTTYSSFNLETTNLLRERAWGGAIVNLGVTVVGCFVAGLLGLALARRLAGG